MMCQFDNGFVDGFVWTILANYQNQKEDIIPYDQQGFWSYC